LSGVKDPLAGAGVPYVEQVFPALDGAAPNAIAFGRDYEHPWAVHALVMGTFRVRSSYLLRQLAERWLGAAHPRSADAGAALCILAYRELERGGGDAGLLSRIREYCTGEAANPHARRWQVSLRFVQGQLHLRRGELGAAETYFRLCAGEDATAFAPHLETKTTEAAWLAGRLALERGDAATAQSEWNGAGNALERLKAVPVADWLVTPARPAAFEAGDGLREIGMAVYNVTLCANGLRRLRDSSGAWRPGPGPVDRNVQRSVGRLLDVVRDRGGEILAWRGRVDRAEAELHDVHDRWRVTRETLHDVQQRLEGAMNEVGRLNAVARTAARATAERAVLEARAGRRRHARTEGGDPPLRVGIFGAGVAGMKVWEALADSECADVVWFADNDPRQQGQALLRIDVIPPADIPRRSFDAIVIASASRDPIRAQLHALGVSEDRLSAPDVQGPIAQIRRELEAEFDGRRTRARVLRTQRR
jgi:hypothetical protein